MYHLQTNLSLIQNWSNEVFVVYFCVVDPDVRFTAVSSFIFLRFFAPAILSPNLFHLRPHHPVSLIFSKQAHTPRMERAFVNKLQAHILMKDIISSC